MPWYGIYMRSGTIIKNRSRAIFGQFSGIYYTTFPSPGTRYLYRYVQRGNYHTVPVPRVSYVHVWSSLAS